MAISRYFRPICISNISRLQEMRQPLRERIILILDLEVILAMKGFPLSVELINVAKNLPQITSKALKEAFRVVPLGEIEGKRSFEYMEEFLPIWKECDMCYMQLAIIDTGASIRAEYLQSLGLEEAEKLADDVQRRELKDAEERAECEQRLKKHEEKVWQIWEQANLAANAGEKGAENFCETLSSFNELPHYLLMDEEFGRQLLLQMKYIP